MTETARQVNWDFVFRLQERIAKLEDENEWMHRRIKALEENRQPLKPIELKPGETYTIIYGNPQVCG